jgi:ATP-dependent RNA helicase DeaD
MTQTKNDQETAALSTHTFKELGLDGKIEKALAENGFDKPFPIQEAVIPLILSGSDVIGQAHTGTGKTTAYALPLLTRMIRSSNNGNIGKSLQVLIMVPTRELAVQVRNEIVRFSKHLHIWTVSIYGGRELWSTGRPGEGRRANSRCHAGKAARSHEERIDKT